MIRISVPFSRFNMFMIHPKKSFWFISFTSTRFQRILWLLLILLLIYAIFTVFFLNSPPHDNLIDYEDQVCRLPTLDINNPEIMKYLKRQPPIQCNEEEDWVEIDGSIVRIKEKMKIKYGNIQCDFYDIVRSSDFGTFLGRQVSSSTEIDLEESDFFRVHCKSSSGNEWENRMAGVRTDPDIFERVGWEYVPKDGLHLNVLMFGFDSLSRLSWQRLLPKTYEKLEFLNAIVLKDYNILGDGTPQAIIPLLTGTIDKINEKVLSSYDSHLGRTELEMPDTRKRKRSKAQYVNVYPFIWNDYRKLGYVTAFMEDTPDVGIFTYRLKGFNSQPTDHYMRTWYVDAADTFERNKPYCMGSIPRHKVMMDYARHIFTVYKDKPKFVFGFHGELSHDSFDLISSADDDVVEWIEWFESHGHLNNTILIMMSDHGHRFAQMRNTQQGKLEERLPFFSFTFPKWFQSKYPEAYNNLKQNEHRLTTPFDINKTLKDILHFMNGGLGSLEDRAISLFKKIPKQRSCRDAGIEPHWCACLVWQNVDPHLNVVRRAAREFVSFINEYNSKYSNLCETLDAKEILDAVRLLPNKKVLSFKSSMDQDGFVPDLTGTLKISSEVLQIKIRTDPGNGLFEFSTIYDINADKFIFQISDISRVNKYGSDASCIMDTQEQLRKYCYCKH